MKYLDFKEAYMAFQQIGQIPELPISRILAVNMKKMKPLIEQKEEEVEQIIDKHAKLGEDGQRLGVYIEIVGEDGKITQERTDISNGFRYSDIDVENKEAYDKEIKDFLNQEIEYNFITMPSNKMVTRRVPREYLNGDKKEVKTVEVEKELLDVLEEKVSANFLVRLLETIVDYVD